MKKEQWKNALISICIGAGVAFFSSLFEGLLGFLKGYGNDIVGGATTSLWYVAKHFRG